MTFSVNRSKIFAGEQELQERVLDNRERDQQGAGLPGVGGPELYAGGGEPPLHRDQVGINS